MVAKVEISSEALAAIRAHAAEEPAREVCGLLLGSQGRIEEARRTANVSESPADSFEIDPATLFAAIRAERVGGARVLGHYHSHPGGVTEPSARDAMMARDAGRLWLIVADDRIGLWSAKAPGRLTRETLAIG